MRNDGKTSLGSRSSFRWHRNMEGEGRPPPFRKRVKRIFRRIRPALHKALWIFYGKAVYAFIVHSPDVLRVVKEIVESSQKAPSLVFFEKIKIQS
jgi:hypothetical protein